MPTPTIPVIYKYLPAEDYLPKILSGESLKFSSPLDFNDPFECKPLCLIELGKAGDRFLSQGCKELGYSPAKRIKKKGELRRFQGRALPSGLESNMSELLKGIGISCFSEARDSILMWAHYAAEHSGVCIGFDTTKHFFQTAWQVQYQDALPIIYRPSDSPDTMLSKSLLTKSIHWKYEREWRIVRRTMTLEQQRATACKYAHCSSEELEVMANQNGPGFYRFPNQVISEVILGVKMKPEKKLQVLRWIQEAKIEVPIYEARRHPSEFRLEFTKHALHGGRLGGESRRAAS